MTRIFLAWLCLLLPAVCFDQPDPHRLFRHEIHELRNMLQLPGLALVVLKDGQVVHRQLEGYANLEQKIPVRSDQLFMIASVTKTFTANLLMQYEQEQLASLDDPILKYRFIDLGLGWPYTVNAHTKIRHFVSHTAEDGPGGSFVYNGTRFNFIGGLFEKVTGIKPFTDAYAQELHKRIFTPLQMHRTIVAFPADRSDTMYRHIATPYVYDRQQRRFREDTINYQRWTRVFPSGSVLSTLDDLIKYARSDDDHRLITADNYRRVTTPTVLSDGSVSPYGIGWFSETFAGKQIHWHYGHADSYASLYIRVPETGYTLIFLCNANAPSEALRLGAGQLWQSSFANAFLRHFVFKKDPAALSTLATEDSIGRALFNWYAQRTFGTANGAAHAIIARLAESHPQRFDKYDPGLVYLLTDMLDASFAPLVDRLAAGYRRYGHIQPYVAFDLARYYDSTTAPAQALAFYRHLADAKGLETWWQSTEACRRTGQLLIKQNQKEEGRRYYWKAVNLAKMQDADDASLQRLIDEMNRLCQQ